MEVLFLFFLAFFVQKNLEKLPKVGASQHALGVQKLRHFQPATEKEFPLASAASRPSGGDL